MPNVKKKVVWVSLAKRRPPEGEPHFLVTNNLKARNAYGHRSHVWLVSMIHEHKPGDKTLYGNDAFQEYGRFCAFTEGMGRVRGLTHWASLREFLE